MTNKIKVIGAALLFAAGTTFAAVEQAPVYKAGAELGPTNSVTKADSSSATGSASQYKAIPKVQASKGGQYGQTAAQSSSTSKYNSNSARRPVAKNLSRSPSVSGTSTAYVVGKKLTLARRQHRSIVLKRRAAPRSIVLGAGLIPTTQGLNRSIFGLSTNGTTFVGIPQRLDTAIQQNALKQFSESEPYQMPKLRRGPQGKKLLALTFDDGPHKTYTLELLRILEKAKAPATFFVVGKQIAKFPTLIQLEVLEGNELGNHTYNHMNLSKLNPPRIAFELDTCDKLIDRLVGSHTRFFRPPGGDYTNDVINAVEQRHYITALWTCDPGDYKIPGADVLLQRSIDRISPGAIYLFHDGMPETMAMLPTLISVARRRGYQFVTLSKLVQ